MSDERERYSRDDPADSATPSGQAPDDPGAREPLPIELLSAYLENDPDLAPDQREVLEVRLARDAGFRQSYAELDVIRQGLDELPAVSAPRDYHLTPQTLGIPEPARLFDPEPWYARHADGLRRASGLAAILFVFVLGADLVVNTLNQPGGDDASESMVPQTEMLATDAAAGGGVAADDAASGAMEAEESGGDEAEAGDIDAASGDLPVAGAAEQAPTEAAAGGESAPPADSEAESTPADEASDQSAPPADAGDEPATAAILSDEEATPTGSAVADDLAREEAAFEEQAEPTLEAQAFALEQDAAENSVVVSDDDGGGLRTWRIVEFGLVALIGVLVTASVILPRLGRRGRSGH